METFASAQKDVAEYNQKIAEHNAAIERKQHQGYAEQREADWISKHGRSAAWWLPTENKEVLPPETEKDAA